MKVKLQTSPRGGLNTNQKMEFKRIKKEEVSVSLNSKPFSYSSECFLLDAQEKDINSYSKFYDDSIKASLLKERNFHMLYIERFPSPVTRIRSYKGLSKNGRNKEFFINENESYLSLSLPINDKSVNTIFDYFFAPNNCFLIQAEEKKVRSIHEKCLAYNFYSEDSSFWFDYIKLCSILSVNEKIIHYHVDSNNENLFGFKILTPLWS